MEKGGDLLRGSLLQNILFVVCRSSSPFMALDKRYKIVQFYHKFVSGVEWSGWLQKSLCGIQQRRRGGGGIRFKLNCGQVHFLDYRLLFPSLAAVSHVASLTGMHATNDHHLLLLLLIHPPLKQIPCRCHCQGPFITEIHLDTPLQVTSIHHWHRFALYAKKTRYIPLTRVFKSGLDPLQSAIPGPPPAIIDFIWRRY